MTAMLDDVIQNLLDRLESEPDNRYLIRVAYDALLEAGRDKEAVELECRCWLKAKKRRPWNFEAELGQNHTDKDWWFVSIAPTDLKGSIPYCHWMPRLLYEYIPRGPATRHKTRESAIAEFVDRWLNLSRERQDELWQWEPPQ